MLRDFTEAGAESLFEGGPPGKLQTVLGLMAPGRPKIRFRVGVAILLGWAPLLVLTALQDAMLKDGSLHGFLTDYAVLARSVIAVPLLILAEGFCLPRLSSIVRHIRDTALVRTDEQPIFDHALTSTLRLRDSMHLEIAVVALAAALLVTLFVTVPPNIFPAWHRLAGGDRISPAGWWHALVSIPILAILLLGWVWRLVLWTRFLWLVSRLHLRLVPAHPDRAGGLRFLGTSTQAFSILACAIGTIIAGTVANRVVHDGAQLMSFRYVVLGYDGLCLALFVSPLLVFTSQLMEAWQRGTQEYGALARRLGHAMERKWLNHDLEGDALETNDFSATTDFYSIAANVYTINVVPVGLRQLLILAIGAVAPFLPVILVSVPPMVLWQKLSSLLF